MTMDVSKKRRKKIKEIADRILREKQLRSGLASSLFGKARIPDLPMLREPWQGMLTTNHGTRVPTRRVIADERTARLCRIHQLPMRPPPPKPPFELPLKPSPKERVVK